MLNSRTCWLRIAAVVASLALPSLSSAQAPSAKGDPAQGKAGAQSTSAVRTRGGGKDANVKKDEATNDPKKAKGTEPAGKAARGAAAPEPGQLCVDSRVDLYVRIYVNGDYVGTVSPWGDACGYYGGGSHSLYAKAVYTDGSYDSWGPTTANLSYGFKWTLRP